MPVFFVLMGMRTDLSAFAAPGVLGLAAALTSVAIIGKQACALGVLAPGVNRLAVGIGMIPRGEVGLIFANIGARTHARRRAGHRARRPSRRSSSWSIVTTMVTPPALKWSLARGARAERPPVQSPT